MLFKMLYYHNGFQNVKILFRFPTILNFNLDLCNLNNKHVNAFLKCFFFHQDGIFNMNKFYVLSFCKPSWKLA